MSKFNMIDTPEPSRVAASAALFQADGVHAVGAYYYRGKSFKEQLSYPVAKLLSDKGFYVVSIYESGFPTSVDYFTETNAQRDGERIIACAESAKQPRATPIYPCVDYNAELAHLSAIAAYFGTVHRIVKSADYLLGVYGSGLVCRHLTELGLVCKTWLSESTAFRGHQDWLEKANIVQIKSTTLHGIDVDLNRTAATGGGGWRIA